MTETWNQWQGRVVDGQFTLGAYLGGSDHSAVYETEIAGPERRKAAIKFVAESPEEDAQLHRWEMAAGLLHPNLQRVFHSGTCRLDEKELLYVVMELAEEDLSQVLPQRALTPEETRAMLQPVLEALGYLHGKGLVHTRLKPSNILAMGDQVKVSCDAICPSGAAIIRRGAKSSYDAPEAEAGAASPASDIWSLGVVLVETLTQRHPSWLETGAGEAELAESLPSPFQSIVAHAIVREPAQRWNVMDIRAELDPSMRVRPPEAKTTETPKPVATATAPARTPARPTPNPSGPTVPHNQPSVRAARRVSPLWIIIPGIVISAGLVAWIAITRSTPSATPDSSAVASTERGPAQTARTAKNGESSRRGAKTPNKSQAKSETPDIPPATPARLDESASSRPVTGSASKGQILDQVIPEVSQKARDTIRGTVRVGVRVHVDASGSVSSAELESPGPSKYFADRALEAVRKWEFISPEVGGRSVASEWVVRFDFTQSSTKAYPKQVSP